MSVRQLLRWLCAIAVAAVCTGCSGGGGNGQAFTVLATLQANMSGDQASTVVDPDARGTVLIEVRSNGVLVFSITVSESFVAEITGVAIHRGAAGVSGPEVVDLLGGGATFSPTTFTASGQITIPEVLAQEIAGAPEEFYVNITTTSAVDGIVRSQLDSPLVQEWFTKLRGDLEVTVIDPNASGAATFRADTDHIDYVIALVNPPVIEAVAAHIHIGDPGVNGAVLVDLNLAAGTVDPIAGTISGSVPVTRDVITRVMTEADGFYCNVHTLVAPDGIARGQLGMGTAEFWAALRGDLEVDVVDPDARGGMTLRLDSFTSGHATVAVPSDEIDVTSLIGAHVHVGAAGVNGTVVIDLQGGSDYAGTNATGSAEGTITCTQALFTRILADPAGFYANFHTSGAVDGLVRGQLTQEPQTFFAALRGDLEVDIVDPTVQGAITLVFDRIHRCSINLSLVVPPATDVIGLHIHDGPAGVNGPILADLLGGGAMADATSITGSADVTGRTFARLLAAARNFYCNAHTSVAPDGIARGQIQHAPAGLPPAGIAYMTPVTYQTGGPIQQNVPTITAGGGGITSFEISPALPAGLSLDTLTGIISGTPLATIVQTSFTVTASNAAGSTMATIDITVIPGAPANLTYSQNPAIYTVGVATTNTPSNTGGAISSYTVVNGVIPAGLTLNATTGVITGTPTTPQAATGVTIRGSNVTGFVDVVVTITINAALQPPNISYTSPVTYTTGSPISNNTPTNTGGAVVSYTALTTLPAGLTLNTTTGVISGTPTTVTAQATYMIQASNAAGQQTANVVITIALGAPTNLSYSPNSALGYVTGPFTFPNMNPSWQGGTPTNFSISPALSAGLSINPTTGVIGGTPTAQDAGTTYTITASNSAGSTTATVSITVLP